MGMKSIKGHLFGHKLILFCLRVIAIYWVSFMLATHTSVFEHGITRGPFHAAVIITLVLYRLLCIAAVPAVLVVWLFDTIGRKQCSQKAR